MYSSRHRLDSLLNTPHSPANITPTLVALGCSSSMAASRIYIYHQLHSMLDNMSWYSRCSQRYTHDLQITTIFPRYFLQTRLVTSFSLHRLANTYDKTKIRTHFVDFQCGRPLLRWL
jgi:hypothetical protein